MKRGWLANLHTILLFTISPNDTKCLNVSVRLTAWCRCFFVGSPMPYGNNVGKAIVARPSVVNSLTGVFESSGQVSRVLSCCRMFHIASISVCCCCGTGIKDV